jgi:hypothetical protein
MLDLYIGYNECSLSETSHDLTTFQSPFGMLRLVTLPMGWTNSVPIFQDDVTYILQPEIPETTVPYIDDVPICGPATRYPLPDGSEERIPKNAGIRRFVWEHFQGLNRVVQRVKHSGGTTSFILPQSSDSLLVLPLRNQFPFPDQSISCFKNHCTCIKKSKTKRNAKPRLCYNMVFNPPSPSVYCRTPVEQYARSAA